MFLLIFPTMDSAMKLALIIDCDNAKADPSTAHGRTLQVRGSARTATFYIVIAIK